jgi:hypothetical protein
MFCTGTVGELVGVIKGDGKIIGAGNVGVMTKRLSDLYVQRTAIEGVQGRRLVAALPSGEGLGATVAAVSDRPTNSEDFIQL